MSDPLAAELSKPQYSDLSDAQAATVVNALTVTVRRPVETWRVRQLAIEGGFWSSLVEARDVSATRKLAINVLAWVDDQSGVLQTVDMDRPSVQAMRAALVAAEILTQEQADALAALANVTIPWTQSVGLPEIGIGLVHHAKKAINNG